MSDLVIPDAAVRAAWEAHRDGLVAVQDMLAAAAPAIVAAELRRLASRLEAAFIEGPIDRESAAYHLRTRADKLDPR